MAENFPGPYEVRFYYTTQPATFQPMQHVMKLNIDLTAVPVVGNAFSANDAIQRNGATIALDAWVDLFVDQWDDVMSSVTPDTIDYAELWQYAPLSYDAFYVATYPIAAPGIAVAGAVASGQVIITFRTQEGGIMKLSVMESATGGSITDTPPLIAGWQDIADLITGATNCWLAKDTSYPIATRALFPGSNEALFKKRFRT